MKKVIPFTKTIIFKTRIAEVTNIEVKHTLELKLNNEIEGDILLDGKYKMTEASSIEEEFHYKLPFVIAVDNKYDTSNLNINIGDFYFEIINEEELKLNVDISLDGIENKEEKELELTRHKVSDIEIPVEIEELTEKVVNDPLEELENEIKKDLKESKNEIKKDNTVEEKEKNKNISSIFSSIVSNEETFSTYYVYIVQETDTIESIIDKYKITREELENYNDLNDIKIGSKLIIPCTNE